MLRRVKMSTLLAICGGCGIGVGGMAVLLNKESTKFANQAGFVKTALDMVEKEPEVLQMIGQPYSLGKASVMDLYYGLDTNNVKIRVPVKGSNDSGFIYAFARKKTTTDRLKLFKIEMTFNKIQGKKMILFDVEDKGTEHDVSFVQPEKIIEKSKVEKKTSPIPEGVIPTVDPNAPRKIPKSVLRNRNSKETQSKSTTSDNESSGGSGSDGEQKSPSSS